MVREVARVEEKDEDVKLESEYLIDHLDPEDTFDRNKLQALLRNVPLP
jgi:hypothetical protein